MSPAETDEQPVDAPLTLDKYIAFAALVLGGFFAIADIQIVASSVSVLGAALSATIEEVAWVQSAYLTAEIIVIPLSAWLTSALSTRLVVAGAMTGFTIFSFACACAWDLPSMIVFRALQGLCGGLLIPTLMSSVYLIFPKRLQKTAIAVVGMALTLPIIIGPILGGWITETFSWHWLFLINIPVGTIVVIAVLNTVHFDRPNFQLLRKIDAPGIVLIALFLGTAEYVLKEGTKQNWFESPLIVWLTWLSVGSFVLMIWRELTARNPVVDLRLFQNLQFTLGCFLAFITGLLMFLPPYLLPAMLSSVSGYNSLQIGGVMIVTGVFGCVSAGIASIAGDRADHRVMIFIAVALTSVGMLVDSNLTNQIGYDQLFLGQMLRGLAMLLIGIYSIDLALGDLPTSKVGSGSGFFNLTRNLGGAVGLSAVTWLMETRQDHHYHRLAEALTEGRLAYDAVRTAPGPNFELEQRLLETASAETSIVELTYQLAAREALVMTFNDVWLILALVTAVTFITVPFF
ncbi:MAG: DHA2 family efflux MFS transporter permease subunit, partial [Pseudomonadota bacterium]